MEAPILPNARAVYAASLKKWRRETRFSLLSFAISYLSNDLLGPQERTLVAASA
jgi:hypothetical protein